MTHWLINGDCLQEFHRIPDQSVNLVLCDPPYGTTACKWDAVIPLPIMWAHLNRVLAPGGCIVMTAGQPFTTALIASNYAMFKYCWVWEKPQGVDPFQAKYRPLNNMEDIAVFAPGKTKYNPQHEEGKAYTVHRDKKPRKHELTETQMRPTTTVNAGTRLPKRILRFNQEKGYHPTQKPVALMEYLIRTYTDEWETVLDFTMGSGTTGVAAKQANRAFIGIERDPEYFAIAQARILYG